MGFTVAYTLTVVNMAELAEDGLASSENESTSGVAGSTESIDLSCIHWGYLNCTQLIDPKKIKENVWQTFWVDLCGSTIRLYRDLSLPTNSGDGLPPASLVGPSNENEKKEAFIVLKKGTQISMVDVGYEPYRTRKRLTVNRRNVFRVSFAGRGANSQAPSYLFQAPSKGSMYRWISKLEEGIDIADKPQNETGTDKRLREAKLLSMEQRRYNMIPEMRYPDRDDVDSGMEGDVDEVYDSSKKLAENPRLEILKKRLLEMEELLLQLDKEEMAFLGANDTKLLRRCEFRSSTRKDYLLIPGHPRTFLPKGTDLTILGQFSNNRWRCCVDPPKKTSVALVNGSQSQSETSSEVESILSFDINDEDGFVNMNSNTETLIGSVPTSVLVEMNRSCTSRKKLEDGTPVSSLENTPQLSPFPSPPHSPYSPRKGSRDSIPNNKRSSLRRSIASENLSEQDIWEQFCLPSPPSSPATSRSTSPSLSMSGSHHGSLDDLDFDRTLRNNAKNQNEQMRNETVENEGIGIGGHIDVTLRHGKKHEGERDFLDYREAFFMDDNVPETYIGSDSEDDRMVTVIDEVPPHEAVEAINFGNEPVKLRPKKERRVQEFESESRRGLHPNYAFLVTKKLRQRGISLIVGSSSSEDEDDQEKDAGIPAKLSLRHLNDAFSQYEEEEATEKGPGVRPYSAFVPMKRASITLSTGTKNFVPRKSTRDELLRDYSSPVDTPSALHKNTCTTIAQLGDWSSTENAPPVNQRRTLQLSKANTAGFGFTLQTYGIVQQEGDVEYMTFVLSVEEDGPAYMAGLRPGDVILEVDGKNVEEEEHKAIVSMIHSATSSVRLVVVFVDALRRMKLNTRLKLLQAQLANKEREFEELSKKEEDLLKGKGISSLDLSLPETRERTNSYLYTTELTSSFAKKSSEVHDSLFQYRQPVHYIRPRPSSLPDESNLGKQRVTATTGSDLLQNFSSADLSANRRKPVSDKLIKSFRKKKPSVESFKSYLDLDMTDQDSKENGSGSCSCNFETGIGAGETAKATSTKFGPRASEGEVASTNGSVSRIGKTTSVSPSDKDILSTPPDSTENTRFLNGRQIASGIPDTRRRLEKSSSARTLPQTPSKPKYGANGSSSLESLQLQRIRQPPRPDSYLLAMDAAGDRPLIPKQRTLRNGDGFPYK
ncbi:uncharacterized protein [Montipora capricornis]|uniref:uncharacterized protein isoform X2 n=1 Tax=Montipora capricornis TaxID=246305 RepID=UPI0035F121CF